MKEVEIGDAGIAPEAAHISFEDVLRYGEIIGRVIVTMKSIDSMATGANTKLDVVKVRARGGEFEWDMGSIKRTK